MADSGPRRVERELFLAAFGDPGAGMTDIFDDWELDRLTALLHEQDIRQGQVLWPEGGAIDRLYFMQNGRVRLTREGSPPWTYEGRWFLGALEGHLNRPTRRQATALSDFQTLSISRAAWFDLLEDSFNLRRRAITASATAVARLEELLPSNERPPRSLQMLPASHGPISTLERLAILAEILMAEGAGVQALADLALVIHEVMLEEGEPLFQAGGSRDYFFLVVSGELEARRRNPDVKRYYGLGHIVAGAGALSNRSRDWEASARTPARVFGIPIEAWFDLMEEHFDLFHSTLAMLAREREFILDRLASQAGPEGLVLT